MSKIKLLLCIVGLIICLVLLLMTPPLSKDNIKNTKLAAQVQKLPQLSLSAQKAVANSPVYQLKPSIYTAAVTKTDRDSQSEADPEPAQQTKNCDQDVRDDSCGHLMCPEDRNECSGCGAVMCTQE